VGSAEIDSNSEAHQLSRDRSELAQLVPGKDSMEDFFSPLSFRRDEVRSERTYHRDIVETISGEPYG
jgi:hypothetical protein